jgi:prepilin-type N-terminal cleavage/methylation domain-containing protein
MRRARRRAGGFTLIELLIVMAILIVLMLLGLPALMRMLERQKAYAATTELAALMRQARLEAIKRSLMAGVILDYQTRVATAFVDVDGNNDFNAGDETIGQVTLPPNIWPQGPGDAAPGGADASVGFFENADLEGIALFDPSGAGRFPPPVPPRGAFRLKARDQNYFEVRVSPPITGRVSTRKFIGGDADDEANWWENGRGGKAWRWVEGADDPEPY